MAEVQFTADLTLALIQGMTDFSATRLNKAYKDWDSDFPAREDAGARLDRVFSAIAAVKPEAIKDTIFSIVPSFYPRALVLDDLDRTPSTRALEQKLAEIDERYNDPRPTSERPEVDIAFVAATTSSTQRIRSRQTRFDYIHSFM